MVLSSHEHLGLSVTLITHNRAESVRRTLTSLTHLQPPDLPWELNVIDNNSTDHTRRVIESFANHLPLTYHFESKPGSCEARNTGIRCSRFPMLVFIDDDVTLSDGWLRAYERAFLDQPAASYFGGPIELDLSTCSLPEWMQDKWHQLQPSLRGQLGELNDFQIARIGLSIPNSKSWLFYGANMAYRKAIFERHGLFEPRLGMAGRRRLATEEPFLQRKLLKAGERPFFVDEAQVWHHIRQDELTFRSRWEWARSRGRGAALMDYLSGEAKRFNGHRLRRDLWGSLRALPEMVSRNKFRRLEALTDLTFVWVYELQMLQMQNSTE